LVLAAAKVHKLKWDDAMPTEILIRQIQRGTRGKYGLENVPLESGDFRAKTVATLPSEMAKNLKAAWERRILEIFSLKYFESDKELLSAGIEGDGVDVYYVLMGRDNSPEMGHADTVDIFLVDSQGRLVSRMKKEYGSRYPFRFVDSKGWNYDFLF
jgi:hypothetical protein